MSIELKSLIVLAIVAVVLQVILAAVKRPGWKTFCRDLFWPRIEDSSVIVFHYTCWMGVIVATLILFFNDVGALIKESQSKAGTGATPSLAELIKLTSSSFLSDLSALFIFWVCGFFLTNFLTGFMLKIYAGFFTSQKLTQENTGQRVSNIGPRLERISDTLGFVQKNVEKVGTGLDDVHGELRALDRRVGVADKTLKAALRELDDLGPDVAQPDLIGSDVHLILSVDTILPNSLRPPIHTILFSQVQANWPKKYPNSYNRYFPGISGVALDELLHEAIRACLNRLALHHVQGDFGNNEEWPSELPFPLSIRILMGGAAQLVHTAEDFAGLDCAFPSFMRSRVLNLWVPTLIGRSLFEIAEAVENGEKPPGFPGFTSKWKQAVYGHLQAAGIHVAESRIFEHVSTFSTQNGTDLDCLQIGVRLGQVGYKKDMLVASESKNPVEARRDLLVSCVGLLPVFLAALHFRNVLSFPDTMQYIRAKCDNLDGEPKKARKRALVKQLEHFQNTSIMKPVSDFE